MNEFAEKHSFLVLYPAQTFKANLAKCWNWFKESEQQRDQGEPAIIAGMTREIIKTYKVDSRRVYVAGISAGGAMAMVLGATYPDLYAAAGIQSGVPYGVAHNIPTGLAAIKGIGLASADKLSSAPGGQAKLRSVPTIVFHGDQDSLVHPGNGDQIIAQWLEVGAQQNSAAPKPQVKVEQGQVPGGHAYTRSIYHDEDGVTLMEQWLVHGAGHAWSGGNPNVAWTDAKGPNASQEMLRFFYEHPHPEA
jgi:poly(hydroxyalkanoate) depolymerase family esterase